MSDPAKLLHPAQRKQCPRPQRSQPNASFWSPSLCSAIFSIRAKTPFVQFAVTNGGEVTLDTCVVWCCYAERNNWFLHKCKKLAFTIYYALLESATKLNQINHKLCVSRSVEQSLDNNKNNYVFQLILINPWDPIARGAKVVRLRSRVGAGARWETWKRMIRVALGEFDVDLCG